MLHERRCPLCAATDCLDHVGEANTDDLTRLYERELGLDVRSEIAGIERVVLWRCSACGLLHFDPGPAGSAQFYEALQDFDWYYLSEKPEYDVARKHLRPGDRVLEIGSGRGAFAALLPPEALYVGLELSRRAVDTARAAGVDARLATVEEHAGAHAGEYDAVVSFQVLEHVPRPADFLTAAVACLRPGGLLVVSVPNADGFMGALSNNVLNLPPHHVTWWPSDALASLTSLLPLEIVERVDDELAPEHYGVYARHLLLTAVGMRRRPDRLVHLGPGQRAAERLADAIARPLARAFRDPRMRPRGHSVTVTYRAL